MLLLRIRPSVSCRVICAQFDTIDGYDPAQAKGASWLLSVERTEWSDRISAALIVRAHTRSRQCSVMPMHNCWPLCALQPAELAAMLLPIVLSCC